MGTAVKSPERVVVKGCEAKKIRPTGSRVLIKVESINRVTAGGITLPDTVAQGQRPARGLVVAVGDNTKMINVGDYAVFMMYAGSVIEDVNTDLAGPSSTEVFRMVREEEVFGIWPAGTWEYAETTESGSEDPA